MITIWVSRTEYDAIEWALDCMRQNPGEGFDQTYDIKDLPTLSKRHNVLTGRYLLIHEYDGTDLDAILDDLLYRLESQAVDMAEQDKRISEVRMLKRLGAKIRRSLKETRGKDLA